MSITLSNMKYDGISYCEAKGIAACFNAYASDCAGDEIVAVGFNPNSEYTFICLENGVEIVSMRGCEAEYLRTNPEDGEEVFFDDYDEALAHDWDAEETDTEE